MAYGSGKVYIADSYNHKIKEADLATRTISTLAGTGVPGTGTHDEPQFNEPGGLSLAGNRLYVADTNNNRVQYFKDLQPAVEPTSVGRVKGLFK